MVAAVVTSLVFIPPHIRDELVFLSRLSLPNEMVGILYGRHGRIEGFYPLKNLDRSSSSYRADPIQQKAVMDQMEAAGVDLLGIAHSHPITDAEPSMLDRERAYYTDVLMIIVSMMDPTWPTIRAWQHDGTDWVEAAMNGGNRV
jgi:proteasome lid subunit RPN8/RPN11